MYTCCTTRSKHTLPEDYWAQSQYTPCNFSLGFHGEKKKHELTVCIHVVPLVVSIPSLRIIGRNPNIPHVISFWVFMVMSPNGNIFRVTGHLCGEFTGHRWIPRTKAYDVELWCFFDLRLNKRLSKQSWGSWFETPSRTLWRHCNAFQRMTWAW